VSRAPDRLIAPLVALVAASAAICAAAAFGAPKERASHPPKIIQISYDESDDGSSPPRNLQAFVRYTTHSVHFATSYHGRRATADGRYKPNVTDTDIHGEGARHPWAIVRDDAGRRLLRLIHRSLEQRGFARVHVRARHGGLLDDVKTRIVLSECAQDPPLYPVSCEVRP
jgi:hypothetical protein